MKTYILEDVLVVFNETEEAIFCFSRKQHRKYSINRDMYELLEYIYENPGIDDTVLEQQFSLDLSILDNLRMMHIITDVKQARFHNVKYLSHTNTARIVFEITDDCNLQCKHCFGSFGIEKSYMPYSTFVAAVKQAACQNVYEITITGGEPFLHPELSDMLRCLYEHGMHVTLFSNLTILNMMSPILSAPETVSKVITSIESVHDDVHDEFRGQTGSREKTLAVIKKLRTAEIPVTINVVVGNHNCSELQTLLEYLSGLNVEIVMDITSPEGRARNNELDYENVVLAIRRTVVDADNIILSKDCGVGWKFIYICANGNVVPCSSLKIPPFIFGNLKDGYTIEVGFTDVYTFFKEIRGCGDREKSLQQCVNCNGGCRARALDMTGNLAGQDPLYCAINKERAAV